MKENRTRKIEVRLRPSEYDKVVERSRQAGAKNVTEYIRERIFLNDPGRSGAVAAELKRLNYEIGKIGVNINQIAHRVNGGYGFSHGDFKFLNEKLCQINNLIRNFVKANGGTGHGDYTITSSEGMYKETTEAFGERN